jgi:hypothetical protein
VGDCWVEAPGTEVSMIERLATVRAATRVKPEQASKDLMRGSSRPDNGEDQRCPCQRTEAHGQTRRGIGRSTYRGHTTQHGRSVTEARNTGPLSAEGGLWQKSEEPIRAKKPGNAGRAKGLWFGVCHNEFDERGLA